MEKRVSTKSRMDVLINLRFDTEEGSGHGNGRCRGESRDLRDEGDRWN